MSIVKDHGIPVLLSFTSVFKDQGIRVKVFSGSSNSHSMHQQIGHNPLRIVS